MSFILMCKGNTDQLYIQVKKYITEKNLVSANINFNGTIDNYKKINYNIYVNKKWRNYENI